MEAYCIALKDLPAAGHIRWLHLGDHLSKLESPPLHSTSADRLLQGGAHLVVRVIQRMSSDRGKGPGKRGPPACTVRQPPQRSGVLQWIYDTTTGFGFMVFNLARLLYSGVC